MGEFDYLTSENDEGTGKTHPGCNYLAEVVCNKCGWSDPVPTPSVLKKIKRAYKPEELKDVDWCRDGYLEVELERVRDTAEVLETARRHINDLRIMLIRVREEVVDDEPSMWRDLAEVLAQTEEL